VSRQIAEAIAYSAVVLGLMAFVAIMVMWTDRSEWAWLLVFILVFGVKSNSVVK
jgi:hypothetical protein